MEITTISVSESFTSPISHIGGESFAGQDLGPMDDGELTILGDSDTYYVCHRLVWGQGPGWHLRPIDGDWGILWAASWDHSQGDSQVTLKLFTAHWHSLIGLVPTGTTRVLVYLRCVSRTYHALHLERTHS